MPWDLSPSFTSEPSNLSAAWYQTAVLQREGKGWDVLYIQQLQLSFYSVYVYIFFQVRVNEKVLMKPKNTRSIDLQEMFPIPAVQLSLWLLLLFLTAEREAEISNQLVYGRF